MLSYVYTIYVKKQIIPCLYQKILYFDFLILDVDLCFIFYLDFNFYSDFESEFNFVFLIQ